MAILKNSLFFDSRLPNSLLAEEIKIANYLRYRLSVKFRFQKNEVISEEICAKRKENLTHVKVFERIAYMEIAKKKIINSDT